MSDTLITVDNVSKKFCRSLKKSLWYGIKDMGAEFVGRSKSHNALRVGEFWANKDISFEVKRGETIGLIGHNGAGKTTLLRMLNGLIKPDKGRIEIRGRMQALIALGAGFNPILTGRENIYVNAAVLGIPKSEIDRKFDEIVDFAGIGEFIDAPVQSYSSGMAVRLGFAVAANMEPDILLVDEVLAVGDRNFQAKCLNKIGELRKKGMTTIFVSHDMRTIGAFCSQSVFIKQGQLLAYGKTREIVARYIADAQTFVDRVNMPAVVGSGGVEIKKVVVNGDTGVVRASDKFELEILYFSRGDVDNCELDIVFRDETDLIIYQGSNLFYNINLNLKGGQGLIIVSCEGLFFNNLSITASIALWSNKREELFDWKNEINFYVEGNPLSAGKVFLQPQYRVMSC